MQTPLIGLMTPEQILRKTPFTIPIPGAVNAPGNQLNPGNLSVFPLDDVKREIKTQADFIREYNITSHNINFLKYYPNPIEFNKKSGKYQAKVRTRIAIGFQERIKTKRITALLGNNVGMKLVTGTPSAKQTENLAFFRGGWEEKNIEVAIQRAIEADYITADTAVCFYMKDGKVNWRTFSYLEGDVLYPHYDPFTGELALIGRLYNAADWDGERQLRLDVWDTKNVVHYYQEKDSQKWRVDGNVEKHGFPGCPVAYHRSIGPVWAASQPLIESYELGISQFSENNAAYALRILYTLGGDFEVMTSTDGTPTRIDSTDANAKVGFLEPAQGADGAFAKELEIKEKNIMRGSFAVETPEIKSGADMSSRTVKMLFADSYLKAIEESLEYQMFLDRICSLFKYGYFLENNKANEIDGFKVKPFLEPFIFMSEADIINAIQQLVAAGCLSKRTATEIAYNSGYGTADEWDRIIQEAHDELVATQKAQAAAQTTAKQNPVAQSRQSK